MTLGDFMAGLRNLRADEYLDVTVVTPDGVHHNVAGVSISQDDEGDAVVCVEFED